MSYLSAIAAPVVLMMSSFIIVYITLGNGFVKLLLSKLNSKKKNIKIEMLAKRKLTVLNQ